ERQLDLLRLALLDRRAHGPVPQRGAEGEAVLGSGVPALGPLVTAERGQGEAGGGERHEQVAHGFLSCFGRGIGRLVRWERTDLLFTQATVVPFEWSGPGSAGRPANCFPAVGDRVPSRRSERLGNL